MVIATPAVAVAVASEPEPFPCQPESPMQSQSVPVVLAQMQIPPTGARQVFRRSTLLAAAAADLFTTLRALAALVVAADGPVMAQPALLVQAHLVKATAAAPVFLDLLMQVQAAAAEQAQ